MRGNYSDLWDTAKVLTTWSSETNAAVDDIVVHKARYEEVQNKTGVPWYVVAILHSLESGRDFGSWLANGDSLKRPTVQVPAGLGQGEKFPVSFLRGCELSLERDGFKGSVQWSNIEVLLEMLESYNGFGYKSRGFNSPYLWSGTQHYAKGKYVADGVWDADAVSAQLGCATLLKEIQNRGLLNVSNTSPVVTWFDIQKDSKNTPTISAYAGASLIAQLQSSNKLDIVNFLNKFPSAGTVLVAPHTKPIPPLTGSAASSVNTNLLSFYKAKPNYDKVYDDVMQWYGTLSNACVAFMSTALRMSGYRVPMGEISLVTTPFSDYLISKGWRKITMEQLLPGDVCFSIETTDPGYPSHTYMFLDWANVATKSASIIDNQGFTHERNMLPGGSRDPFQYGLRAP